MAEDFADSLREIFGMKKQVSNLKDVALPSKAASRGPTPNVEALAQRFLAIFPQYKDAYREHMAKYGEFLYQDFFARTAAVKLKELCADPKANKKQLEKFFDLLNEMYAEGDANVLQHGDLHHPGQRLRRGCGKVRFLKGTIWRSAPTCGRTAGPCSTASRATKSCRPACCKRHKENAEGSPAFHRDNL